MPYRGSRQNLYLRWYDIASVARKIPRLERSQLTMSTARIAELLKVSRQFTLWFLFLCEEPGISPHKRINIQVSALLVTRQELHLPNPMPKVCGIEHNEELLVRTARVSCKTEK
jgi:hypothetical protein